VGISGATSTLFALLTLNACATPSHHPSDTALLAATAVVTIRSGQPPFCNALGAATHLGAGLFVTAAHVVDGSVQRLRDGCPPTTAVTLAPDGAPVPGTVVRAGRDRIEPVVGQRYLAGEDLALIRMAAPVRDLPATPPCAADPATGASALLITPRRAIRTRIAGLFRESDPAFGAYLEIPVTLDPGDSGGAVLEAVTGCLAGIISHRDEDGGPPRTRLVPASVIRRFAGRDQPALPPAPGRW
jgi:hypothetical protein